MPYINISTSVNVEDKEKILEEVKSPIDNPSPPTTEITVEPPIDTTVETVKEEPKASTIIVEKDKLKHDISFSCKTRNLIRASRNIFLEEKLSVDFCKLN